MSDRCRSCGAPVLWLEHESTGKRAPIDADPSPEGNIEVDAPRGTYRVLSGFVWDEAVAGGEQLRTCHFHTCPQPDERKTRSHGAGL
jgi:hypothetical protein